RPVVASGSLAHPAGLTSEPLVATVRRFGPWSQAARLRTRRGSQASRVWPRSGGSARGRQRLACAPGGAHKRAACGHGPAVRPVVASGSLAHPAGLTSEPLVATVRRFGPWSQAARLRTRRGSQASRLWPRSGGSARGRKRLACAPGGAHKRAACGHGPAVRPVGGSGSLAHPAGLTSEPLVATVRRFGPWSQAARLRTRRGSQASRLWPRSGGSARGRKRLACAPGGAHKRAACGHGPAVRPVVASGSLAHPAGLTSEPRVATVRRFGPWAAAARLRTRRGSQASRLWPRSGGSARGRKRLACAPGGAHKRAACGHGPAVRPVVASGSLAHPAGLTSEPLVATVRRFGPWSQAARLRT